MACDEFKFVDKNGFQDLFYKILDNSSWQIWLYRGKHFKDFMHRCSKSTEIVSGRWDKSLAMLKSDLGCYSLFQHASEVEKTKVLQLKNRPKRNKPKILFMQDPGIVIEDFNENTPYSQEDFEKENFAFKLLYTVDDHWDWFAMHFCPKVYLYGDLTLVGFGCKLNMRHSDPWARLLSVAKTNYAIKILNKYVKVPLQSFGSNPSDEQINMLYQNILALGGKALPTYLLGESAESIKMLKIDLSNRVSNIFFKYFFHEFELLLNWFRKIYPVKSEAETMLRFLKPQIGSVTYALGLELEREFSRGA